MKTIIVAGASSKAGKTSLAEALLRWLPRRSWGGVKITVARDIFGDYRRGGAVAAESTASGYRIISDPEILSRPNTDTKRLIRAGGNPVLWAITTPPSVWRAWEDLRHRLDEVAGVVIESNSLAQRIEADVFFFTVNPRVPRNRWKSSAAALIEQSDFVIVSLHEADRERAQALIDEVDAKRRGRGVIVVEAVERALDRDEVGARLRALVTGSDRP